MNYCESALTATLVNEQREQVSRVVSDRNRNKNKAKAWQQLKCFIERRAGLRKLSINISQTHEQRNSQLFRSFGIFRIQFCNKTTKIVSVDRASINK